MNFKALKNAKIYKYSTAEEISIVDGSRLYEKLCKIHVNIY